MAINKEKLEKSIKDKIAAAEANKTNTGWIPADAIIENLSEVINDIESGVLDE